MTTPLSQSQIDIRTLKTAKGKINVIKTKLHHAELYNNKLINKRKLLLSKLNNNLKTVEEISHEENELLLRITEARLLHDLLLFNKKYKEYYLSMQKSEVSVETNDINRKGSDNIYMKRKLLNKQEEVKELLNIINNIKNVIININKDIGIVVVEGEEFIREAIAIRE
eukprot:Tbor_TRINITY_DN5766_c0_g1::TRINITY_DN5766_c0_g1_i1::g.19726::m.19726